MKKYTIGPCKIGQTSSTYSWSQPYSDPIPTKIHKYFDYIERYEYSKPNLPHLSKAKEGELCWACVGCINDGLED